MADEETLLNKMPAGPDWLSAARDHAVAEYGVQGLPRAKTEAWKFTNLNPLKALDPVPAPERDFDGSLPLPVGLDGLEAARIVMMDGRVVDHDKMPDGVEAVAIDDSAPAWVSETVGGIASVEQHPFTALNTAQFGAGIAIRVARGKAVETPIHLVHLSTAGDATEISHPRVLVVVEDGAVADLVESHVGSGCYIRNAVTEISVGADAKLGHYKLQADSPEAFHIAMTAVTTGRGASYDNFALSTGSRLARNEVRGHLGGEHVEYHVNGAYMATGDQHLDTSTFIDHAEPHCTSHELYKGVLTERGHGVFQGKILVRPHAQKTDGYQMNRALLLSREAEIDSKPELEIYADDVKCSHGATVGELEDDQLFYLMARGVPQARARALLVAAYVDEAIDTIDREPVREAFRTAAADWMARHISAE